MGATFVVTLREAFEAALLLGHRLHVPRQDRRPCPALTWREPSAARWACWPASPWASRVSYLSGPLARSRPRRLGATDGHLRRSRPCSRGTAGGCAVTRARCGATSSADWTRRARTADCGSSGSSLHRRIPRGRGDRAVPVGDCQPKPAAGQRGCRRCAGCGGGRGARLAHLPRRPAHQLAALLRCDLRAAPADRRGAVQHGSGQVAGLRMAAGRRSSPGHLERAQRPRSRRRNARRAVGYRARPSAVEVAGLASSICWRGGWLSSAARALGIPRRG